MSALTKTPSGETIEKVRGLLRKMDGNPKMRRAVAAAIKAMRLPDPLPASSSPDELKDKPSPAGGVQMAATAKGQAKS